jgi:hypothetical protein
MFCAKIVFAAADRRARGDLADEQRDVDFGRAGVLQGAS